MKNTGALRSRLLSFCAASRRREWNDPCGACIYVAFNKLKRKPQNLKNLYVQSNIVTRAFLASIFK